MIAILHGYLLEGSGSNLWTREIIQSMCHNGETIHLVCQENHPEIYDFINRVYVYHPNGAKENILERQTLYSGNCIMHKPILGNTLPVYVQDQYEEFADVRPMIELNDEEIENYLQTNIKVLSRIVNENNISVIHANHAVLMSVVAQHIAETFQIPYAIMPHGSAIEYAVKKDKRMYEMAENAFRHANRLYVIGKEIRNRVRNLFSDLADVETKMVELNLGVNTSHFKPVAVDERKNNINNLIKLKMLEI